MRLEIRPAEPKDVPALVDLYDDGYHGGYSACFDRYGPATPQDVWWVQSEKLVYVVEIDATPAGLVILSRAGQQMLAEELLIRFPEGAKERETRTRLSDTVIRRAYEFLVTRFQQERQEQLTLRCAETNTSALSLVRRYGFAFANALIVVAGAVRKEVKAPDGYVIRRAGTADARNVARLHEETRNVRGRGEDLGALGTHPDSRVFIAEREQFPVGLALAQAKDGVGRWTVGVREAHRHKGIGTALAQEALQFFHLKKLTPITTYWALDTEVTRFMRTLDGRTERTYLYFEKQI